MFNTVILPKKPATMQVVSYRRMTSGVYDITAKFKPNTPRDDAASLFREATKGKMAMIAGTYRDVACRNGDMMRFTAKATATVKAYADSAAMTSLGHGEFTDTAGDVWSVVEDGDDRFLVLNSKDDLDDLLNEHKARGLPLTQQQQSHRVETAACDFAAMVTGEGNIVYGIVGQHSGKPVLFDTENNMAHEMDAACIVDAVELPKKVDMAALSSAELKDVLAFLGKYLPKEYVAKYKAAIGA
jgi:hypothetical protein